MRHIYDRLALPDFSIAEPAVHRYAASVSDYRKNAHPDIPSDLPARIAQEWRAGFEAWGYAA